MATHLRMAAVTWLVAAPVFGAGLAHAAPLDVPLSPSSSSGSGSDSPGPSRPGLSSIGDLGKALGGLTSAATTAGTGVLSGFGATSSGGQQLVPRFGDGRNGTNIASSTSAANSSTVVPPVVVGAPPSAPASESASIAETSTAAPSVASVANPVVQAGVAAVDTAGQLAVVAADAPVAPVTALSGPLPQLVAAPLASVAALPAFAVAQTMPVVDGWAAAAAALSSAAIQSLPRATDTVSVERGFGAHVGAPAAVGTLLNSRFAGQGGGTGEPPLRGPVPAPSDIDRTFAAGSRIVAAAPYRAGYSDDLRAAGLGEVAAVAVPGFTGLLVLTGAGGLIGFRQARAGRTMHGGSLTRFAGR